MPFDEVETRQEARTNAPASVRLVRVKRGRIRASIGLRKTLAEQLKWTDAMPIGVLVGTGDDEGKILLVPNSKKPIAKAYLRPKGSIAINLGHIPALGDKSHATQPAKARVLPDGNVEIILPNPDDAPAEETAEDDDTSEGSRAAPNPSGSNQHNRPQADDSEERVSAPGTIERMGVVISVEPPSVGHDGHAIPLSPTEQRFMAILLPSIEQGPIPIAFVAKKMDKSEATVRFTLVNLQDRLGKVDLAIDDTSTKGMLKLHKV